MSRSPFPIRSRFLILTASFSLICAATLGVAATADHAIITEVVTKSRPLGEIRLGSEFIEVANPTATDVDLSDVYLTDATYSPTGILYWKIADGTHDANSIGGGFFNDFHVRFPAGYVLSAGDTLSISVNGSEKYFEAYGRLPDLELYEDGFVPDTVPEMVAVFPGSVHRGDPLREQEAALLPTLGDGAESLILYTWDGSTDLVADLDIMFWGTSADVLFDKSGVTVGASTYLDDTAPASQQPVATTEQNFGQAYARLSADEGTEAISGGNGLTGHDETSENLGTTWQIAATQNPPQAPTTHHVTAPIFLGGSHVPTTPTEDEDVVLSVDVVSETPLTGVDFIYSVDGGVPEVLAGNDWGSGSWQVITASEAAGAAVTWYALATNAAGGTAIWPAGAPTFSEGWIVSEPPDPADWPAKLLITEVSTIGTDQEYVEIANLNDDAVDLSKYYLTDAIYTPSNQVYWRITEGDPTAFAIGGGVFNDWHAQFPAGFTLAAGDTIVVSIAGSQRFTDAFGFPPDIELWEDGGLPDAVPDMRWIFGDEINNSIVNRTGANPSVPTLTNGAELVMLYYWDGLSDDVTDIDLFTWKDPSSTTTSFFFSKTGVTVGTHSYLPETSVADQLNLTFQTQADFGFSYQRIDATEGNQTATGSNGVFGRDETSEDLNNTFALAPYDPSRNPGVIVPPEGAWQVVGSGAYIETNSLAHTWGDFNHDGFDDLFLVSLGVGTANALISGVSIFTSAPMRLFNTTGSPGMSDCVPGDYNQDGDLDIYVTNEAAGDWLYSNLGPEWNYDLMPWPMEEGGVIATTDAEMVDTDLDGWLEIFVTNGAGENKLLDGRFGLNDLFPYSLSNPAGTLGNAWCDLDGDRDPDLAFVANDGGLVIATQGEPRRFSATTLPAATEGRDCAWADFDNDGDFDFVLACVGSDNMLYENRGEGEFVQTPLVQATGDSTSACTWLDFDNDGRLDLYEANLDGPNVMWHNDGGGLWQAVEDTTLSADLRDSGVSWLDIDRDGDLDLYVSSPYVLNRLVRNNLDSQNNWLQVEATGHHWGHQSNLGAIGAVIEVEAGGVVQQRYVGGGESGTGHGPLVQHFGLGTATVVDRVTVHWPFRLPNGSFHSDAQRDVPVNQRVQIEESVYGVSAVEPAPRLINSLQAAQPNPFNPATTIAFSLAQDAMVDLTVFDVKGRRVARLMRGEKVSAGQHRAVWRGLADAGGEAPSGVYFYRLVAGDFVASRRMVLIR